MEKRKIVIFGDSILRGVTINEENNRYTFSKTIDWEGIEKRFDIILENYARIGATISYGYDSIVKYLESGKRCSAAIIGYGGNDCDYNWAEVAADGNIIHPPKTAPVKFEETLDKILDILINYDIKPILMTLPPIFATRYYEWFMQTGLNKENIMKHLGSIDIIYRHQEYYSNIIASVAAKRNIDIANVREKFLLRKDMISLIGKDGIHPNYEGEQIIIKTFLEKYSAD